MEAQVFVIVLARAGYNHNGRVLIFKHRADRAGGSAAAQDQRLAPGDADGKRMQQRFEAVVIGVMPDQRAVLPAKQGVDAANSFRALG